MVKGSIPLVAFILSGQAFIFMPREEGSIFRVIDRIQRYGPMDMTELKIKWEMERNQIHGQPTDFRKLNELLDDKGELCVGRLTKNANK